MSDTFTPGPSPNTVRAAFSRGLLQKRVALAAVLTGSIVVVGCCRHW